MGHRRDLVDGRVAHPPQARRIETVGVEQQDPDRQRQQAPRDVGAGVRGIEQCPRGHADRQRAHIGRDQQATEPVIAAVARPFPGASGQLFEQRGRRGQLDRWRPQLGLGRCGRGHEPYARLSTPLLHLPGPPASRALSWPTPHVTAKVLDKTSPGEYQPALLVAAGLRPPEGADNLVWGPAA